MACLISPVLPDARHFCGSKARLPLHEEKLEGTWKRELVNVVHFYTCNLTCTCSALQAVDAQAGRTGLHVPLHWRGVHSRIWCSWFSLECQPWMRSHRTRVCITLLCRSPTDSEWWNTMKFLSKNSRNGTPFHPLMSCYVCIPRMKLEIVIDNIWYT